MKVEKVHAPACKMIRAFQKKDELGVLEIAAESPESAQWSTGSYARLATENGGLIFVSEEDGKICGFIACRCIAEEAEILNLAVRREHRQRGEATALLEVALKEFHAQKVSRIFLEVRESNAAAIAFYEKHGFAKTGRRGGYYQDPPEAAIVMEKKLTG